MAICIPLGTFTLAKHAGAPWCQLGAAEAHAAELERGRDRKGRNKGSIRTHRDKCTTQGKGPMFLFSNVFPK